MSDHIHVTTGRIDINQVLLAFFSSLSMQVQKDIVKAWSLFTVTEPSEICSTPSFAPPSPEKP
jgi:hypothetical protein